MSQQSKDIVGGLIEASPLGIVGWAHDPANPEKIIRVVLSVGTEPIMNAIADRFDIDVVRRQIGPGIAAFRVMLPHMPSGKPPYTVTARLANGLILGKPLVISNSDQITRCVAGEGNSTLEGMVDLLSSGRLHGWLWDLAAPEKVAEVEIFDNNLLLGRARANNSREDLRLAGKRDGYCGFVFDLPATLLDMKPHAIHVIASGTTYELANSPFQFGPLLVSGLTAEMAQLRKEVDALTAQLKDVTGATGGLQRQVMRVLAERVSAYSAIQAETLERRIEAALPPGGTPAKSPRRRT